MQNAEMEFQTELLIIHKYHLGSSDRFGWRSNGRFESIVQVIFKSTRRTDPKDRESLARRLSRRIPPLALTICRPAYFSRRPRAGLTSGTIGTARIAADAVQAGA